LRDGNVFLLAKGNIDHFTFNIHLFVLTIQEKNRFRKIDILFTPRTGTPCLKLIHGEKVFIV